jgi:hypothetical protein
MRWIEQREARQVLTTALFEQPPKAPWSSAAGDAAAQLLPGLCLWFAARHPMVGAAPNARPGAAPTGGVGVPARCRGDDKRYSSTW